MMNFFQRLGRSLMLPVAVLPAAAILMGIGYWIDPVGWGSENIAAAFLIKAGAAIIDNIPILFAVGVGLGMSKNRDGSAALSSSAIRRRPSSMPASVAKNRRTVSARALASSLR